MAKNRRNGRADGRQKPRGEAELFPLFLKLENRRCLVVGAGRVAEPKIESLVRCGARVRVIAPQATVGIRLAAASGAIVWEERSFRPADLRGAFLVVAATSSPELHQRVFRQAQRAGILCNAVDEPARCDFYYPAVVRRGPLQIAISTSGNSPSLAARLRQELQAALERRLPAGYAKWVHHIGLARARLLAGSGPRNAASRRAKILALSTEAAFRRFQRRAAKPAGTRRVVGRGLSHAKSVIGLSASTAGCRRSLPKPQARVKS